MPCSNRSCIGYHPAAKDLCVTCQEQVNRGAASPRVPERGNLPDGIRWVLSYFMIPVAIFVAIVTVYGNWETIRGWWGR